MAGQVSAISPYRDPVKPSRGFRVGISLSDWRGDAAADKKVSFKPGLVIGGFYTFPLSPDFVIQSEFLISMKGARIKYDYPVFAGELQFEESATIYYAEIPVLAKFPIPWERDSRFSLFMGPVCGISIVGKRSGSHSSYVQNIVADGSYSGKIGNTKRLDLGITIGAEVIFGSSPRKYLIDFRYTAGLLGAFADIDDVGSIDDSERPFIRMDTGEAEKFKNGTFLISFGISLGR
jgi:hypothetical protein